MQLMYLVVDQRQERADDFVVVCVTNLTKLGSEFRRNFARREGKLVHVYIYVYVYVPDDHSETALRG